VNHKGTPERKLEERFDIGDGKHSEEDRGREGERTKSNKRGGIMVLTLHWT